MPHTHVIDGKIQTYDDATCPFCHPEKAQPTSQQQKEQLPKAYRKGGTVVLKISKATVITTNYYEKEKCFLQSTERIMRDQKGKIIFGQDQKPLWDRVTVRIPIHTIREWLMLLSTLTSEIETSQTAPRRD
jgi:hypothetical protein